VGEPTVSRAAWIRLLGWGLTVAAACSDPPAAEPDAGAGADGGDAGDQGGDSGTSLPFGEACQRASDCFDGQRCRTERDLVPNDLAPLRFQCGPPVGNQASGQPCDDNSDCETGFCAFAGSCVDPCLGVDDCPAGSRCTSVLSVTSPGSMQPANACVARFDPPAGVTITDRRRLAVDLRPDALRSVDVLSPPTGVREFLFDGRGASANGITVALVTATEPRLLELFDAGVTQPFAPPPIVGVNTQDNPLVIRYPNGPDAPDDVQALRFSMAATSSEVFLTEFRRSTPARRLDLNLFYVGIGASPSGARGPGRIGRAIDGVAAVIGPEIELGTVRQFEVVGRTAFTFDSPNLDRNQHEAMFEFLTAGAGRAAVNVFFVQTLPSAGGAVLGIAGGIPGPSVAHGTTASGVAVAFDLLPTEQELAAVVAHEVGHYLGLFHTTEVFGISVEPLTDTAVCSFDFDANENGAVEEEECGEADGDNLMFWSGSGTTLSPQQRAVQSTSLVLR
jgi:hypothetical protein